MRSSLIIVLLIGVFNSSSSQINDTIFWTSKIKLKWYDFNFNIADTCYKHHAVAMTCSNIHTRSFMAADSMPNYLIEVYFLKSKSCTTDTLSLLKLGHEQLHFDITELFARKMRKSIENLRNQHEINILVYKATIKNIYADEDKYQDRYDFETSHGRNTPKQLEWGKKVNEEMDIFKLYSSDYNYKIK